MKPLPITEFAQIIRTDFADQAAWEAICATIRKPSIPYGFLAYVAFIDDPEYQDVDKDQLLKILPVDYNKAFLMVVDRAAITLPDHPLLVVDLIVQPGREFRAIPARVQDIENNLSIGNMDFEEFADAVGPDGVFRDFPGE